MRKGHRVIGNEPACADHQRPCASGPRRGSGWRNPCFAHWQRSSGWNGVGAPVTSCMKMLVVNPSGVRVMVATAEVDLRLHRSRDEWSTGMYQLTGGQATLRATVRELAEARIAPAAADVDAT